MTDEPRRTRKQFVAAFAPHGLVHLLDRFAFRLRRARIRLTLRIFALLGFNVARRTDYYSTLPVLEQIQRTRERWDRPSTLPGVNVRA